jgi:hypothetical protein
MIKLALRISRGGVEQDSDSVVANAAEAECAALHALDQVVGGFGPSRRGRSLIV